MNSRDFVFWLQGFFEIGNGNTLTPEQVKVIKEHLSIVFKHDIGESVGHQTTPVQGKSYQKEPLLQPLDHDKLAKLFKDLSAPVFPEPSTTYC